MAPALAFLLIFLFFGPLEVLGHGRLVEPPSRSSMWRFGFKTKPNYNDNELFCGGYTVQWQRNRGKCGVCGDAWHLPQPRPNEAGGIYGRGIITRRYSPGQVIMSTVEITANHKGFFEFKLCPHNDPTTVVGQDCLDRTPLQLADGSGTKYYPSFGTGPFNVQLKLPQHITCSQCVFQWTYTAGNNWGSCENGTSKVGCGPQETFRGCSDITISAAESNDIPFYQGRPPDFIPPNPGHYTTAKPKLRPRPTRPNRRQPNTKPSRRTYYNNRRPPSSPKPSTVIWIPTQQSPSINDRWSPKPTRWYPMSSQWSEPTKPAKRRPTNKRPHEQYPPKRRPTISHRRTSARPAYSNKPSYSKPKQTITKKPRPTYKPKPTSKMSYTKSENLGWSCRAVGAWQSVSGIAEWCESNCPRGYCPSSHCDCSRKR